MNSGLYARAGASATATAAAWANRLLLPMTKLSKTYLEFRPGWAGPPRAGEEGRGAAAAPPAGGGGARQEREGKGRGAAGGGRSTSVDPGPASAWLTVPAAGA